MTPRELAREHDAYVQLQADDRRRDASLAWHTAVFAINALGGKLPDLNVIFQRIALATANSRTPQGRRFQGELLSEHLGVPMKPISQAAIDALSRLKKES